MVLINLPIACGSRLVDISWRSLAKRNATHRFAFQESARLQPVSVSAIPGVWKCLEAGY
jgi:hypothetical protein